MAGFTNYLVTKLVAHALGIEEFTMPTNVYMKIHVGDPGPLCVENASTSTTRKVITWGDVANGLATIDADLSFLLVDRETVSFVSIWDSLTSGNPLMSAPMSSAKNLYAGDTLVISAGTVVIPAAA